MNQLGTATEEGTIGYNDRARMDDLNYRRLVSRPKKRCEKCGATSYQDPAGVFRCMVCDHDRYEVCLDCGDLRGWCLCPPPAKIVATAAKTGTRTAARGSTRTAARKKAKRR